MSDQTPAPMERQWPAGSPYPPLNASNDQGADQPYDDTPEFGGLARVGWTLVPLLSFGFFSWVPFVRFAARRGKRRDWIVAGGYTAVSALSYTLIALANSEPLLAVEGTLLGLLWFPAAVHTNLLFRRRRRRVEDPNAIAYRRAEQSRRRRQEARHILASEPSMARDLRIGRPDLPREFDDGGLVDVNHVPADLLRLALGWTADEAESVVRARAEIGGFTNAAELPAYTDVSQARVDAVGDLLAFGQS